MAYELSHLDVSGLLRSLHAIAGSFEALTEAVQNIEVKLDDLAESLHKGLVGLDGQTPYLEQIDRHIVEQIDRQEASGG